MKQLIYLWIVLLLVFVSCHGENMMELREPAEKETFTMGFQIGNLSPAMSRSFTDELKGNLYPPLWIVVFDGTGHLVEYAKANNFSRQGDEVVFNVTLRATSVKRIVHFLLGYDEHLKLDFGHESAVIGQLEVSGNKGVYWQRVVMRDGLEANLVATHLRKVPLLRNFSKITVKNLDIENFELTGFYVLNIPDRGSVAPYHDGHFVDYWSGYGTIAKDYVTLVEEEGYTGTMPERVEFLHRPGGEDIRLDWIPDGGAFFLYEHTHTDNPDITLSVLLKGRYRGGAETYYKVDIVQQEAERAVYYHILRNFVYEIKVTEVVGNGESDFGEACWGLSGNNLSSSIIVQKVENVSDGTASLRVAYTDTTLVSAAPVVLRYRYLPDITQPGKTGNQKVAAKWLEGEEGLLFESTIEQQATEGGWATFVLTPLELPAYPKQQSLLVYSTDRHLSREVVFEIRPPLPLEMVCTPKDLQGRQGEPVLVEIRLPDALNETLFPLDFLLEAQTMENTASLYNPLSPRSDEAMSVLSGPSIVEGFEGQKAIQFVKSLSYPDYQLLPKSANGSRHLFRCHFVTNTEKGRATVYVYNKYFTKVSDSLGQ